MLPTYTIRASNDSLFIIDPNGEMRVFTDAHTMFTILANEATETNTDIRFSQASLRTLVSLTAPES